MRTHSADFHSAGVVVEFAACADEACSLAGILLQHISSAEVGSSKEAAGDALVTLGWYSPSS